MAIDWSTRVNTRSRKSRSSVTWAESSATAQIRLMEATVSTGYLPLAVSADSITASVPSSTAFATSDTSARVGTGRDHDAFAGRHDIGQRLGLDRLGAFDLGDEERVTAGGEQELPRHVHVGARFGEGNRQVINLDFRRGAYVVHVLGGKRRCGEAAAQAVDAL